MHAIVLSNGTIIDYALLRDRLERLPDKLVIGADGGSHHAPSLGLQLDALIGDLDSIEPEFLEKVRLSGAAFDRYPPRKDETDLELAMLYAAAQQGVHDIVVLGAMGKRMDMSFSNVLLMTHPAFLNVQLSIWEGNQTAWLIRTPGDTINGKTGDTVSLIPIGGDAVRVSTKGLRYRLYEETLFFGPARGVSNVMQSDSVRVDLRGGMLLAVHTPGRA